MINGKTVMGITLARGGSKGIPQKNVIDVNGKPLIQYTIDEVKKSKYIDSIVVSSDDDQILSIAQEQDVDILKRPDFLASNTSTTVDVLLTLSS